MENNPYRSSAPEEPSPRKGLYQFPFAGGLLAGCGFGLLLLLLLIQYGLIQHLGFAGVIGVAMIMIVFGLLVGLPTRASRKK